jgi:hypothetical protein
LVCKNMNPSSIKKIINKKVTFIVILAQIPAKKRSLPISFNRVFKV